MKNSKLIFDKLREMSIFDDDMIDCIEKSDLNALLESLKYACFMAKQRFFSIDDFLHVAVNNIVHDRNDLQHGKLLDSLYADIIVVSRQSIVVNTHMPLELTFLFFAQNMKGKNSVKETDEKTFSDAYKVAKLEIEKQFFYMKDNEPRFDCFMVEDEVKHIKLAVDSIASELSSAN